MKDLLEFLLKAIIPETKIKVEETSDDGRVNLNVTAPKDKIGMIIGKEGKTIKAIRNILRIKATLEKKAVFINVAEAS